LVSLILSDIVQTHAVDSWQPGDIRLPSIFYELNYIFSQFLPPPYAYISPPYFRCVLEAHDAGETIPQIPKNISPPSTSPTHIIGPTMGQRKRKRVMPPHSDSGAAGNAEEKKRRVAGAQELVPGHSRTEVQHRAWGKRECKRCKAEKMRCWGLAGKRGCFHCWAKKVPCSLAQKSPKTPRLGAGTSRAVKETKEKGRGTIVKEGNEMATSGENVTGVAEVARVVVSAGQPVPVLVQAPIVTDPFVCATTATNKVPPRMHIQPFSMNRCSPRHLDSAPFTIARSAAQPAIPMIYPGAGPQVKALMHVLQLLAEQLK
jgi:hypothetical protein